MLAVLRTMFWGGLAPCDHWVRCRLWVSARMLTGSVKGGGTKAIPIQYR